MIIWIHKITCWYAEIKCIEVENAYMQLFIITTEETFIHTSIHSTCSTWLLTANIVAEVKMDKITYLKMNSFRNQLRRCNIPPNHRPACSLISQQHYHPQAGHDSPRNKGTSMLTHSQGYTKHTAKPTQLGLSGHPRVGERLIVKLMSSIQSQEHLH